MTSRLLQVKARAMLLKSDHRPGFFIALKWVGAGCSLRRRVRSRPSILANKVARNGRMRGLNQITYVRFKEALIKSFDVSTGLRGSGRT